MWCLAFGDFGLVCDVWCVGVRCLLFVAFRVLFFVCCVLVFACRNCTLCALRGARCSFLVACLLLLLMNVFV